MAEADALVAATQAALDALRQQGAQRLDPLRFAYLQAFARRTAVHQGPARQLLEQRLQAALAQLASRVQASAGRPGLEPGPAGMAAAAPASVQGPLGMLVQRVDHQAGLPAWPAAASANRPLAELKALKNFRGNWARLAVDNQLRRSQAKAPVNAGPLNSQRVVLRSLQAMRELSPAYLGSFMTYLDTLAWLDEALQADLPPSKSAPRGQAGGAGAGAGAGHSPREPGKKRKSVRGAGA